MIQAIKNRRSIRKYAPEGLTKEQLNDIYRSAMFAPTARHMRAWQFITVTDKDLITKLSKMKPHSMFANNAPAIIVLCSEDWQYWVQDLSIVCAHIYLAATDLGLGTCMVEVYDSKTTDQKSAEDYVRNILNIPADIRILGFMPIGYPAETHPAHTDTEFELAKIHNNTW